MPDAAVSEAARETALSNQAAPVVAAPTLMANATPVASPSASVAVREAAPAAPRLSEQLASARAEHQLTRAQERRYERVLSRVKTEEARREAAGQSKVEAVELILAIFLPPIGVLVHEKGQLTTRFWISLLLTLLFFFPGMIYAILVVTDSI